ncbi:uncharacterized protein SPPG_08830 [Spizellomyces punctatus DAOM BR117]|uniref:Uncharacterized protein n=1 Tax=Spizellomyces punctatus (strain DAOM BR117) TaxID=645134 RepID=A0A0L0HUL6_SPIPD|nr:uncharacterized protein SPPG_08830 [Spizellomyces punctatus DAOM BR117]KND04565.1 hypothetical protein SPPG_08830 [Spizellomyces punctatus DAOM BR117]|eukprot:XP_016612604.1 hypothetical protein SPPG_08830 [Spizellomyces punctatus DAOM BR117]
MRTPMWWCRGPRPPDSNRDQNQRQPIGSDNKTYYYTATLVELGCLQAFVTENPPACDAAQSIRSWMQESGFNAIKSSGSRPSRDRVWWWAIIRLEQPLRIACIIA